MSAKTKIVVLKMKELIYTGVFIGLAILLIAIGVAMFRNGDPGKKDRPSSKETAAATIQYAPGVYTASLPLNNHSVDVEVVVDASQIKNVRLLSLSESIATMYPLMEPTMESLRSQILTNQSTDGITYEDSSKYTAYVLLQAIQNALSKAAQ